MAGQEIEGDLWDQSLGLDLLPTIVCAGFRTLSPGLASVQILGSRDPRLTELALDHKHHSHASGPMSQKGCFTQDLIKLSLGWDTRAV